MLQADYFASGRRLLPRVVFWIFCDASFSSSTWRAVRQLRVKDGRVISVRWLAEEDWAEGITVLRSRLYQLTWQNGLAYVYRATTAVPIDTIRYPFEGWGLTSDGYQLIASDGTDTLRFSRSPICRD